MAAAGSDSPGQTPEYVSGHGLLEGRTVVVTAAAGAGIGSATARRCLEEGARAVVIGDVHERRLDETTATLREEFGEDRVASVLSDVSNEEQVNALLDAAEPFGGVEVLINNAALGGTTSILEMTNDEWSRVIDVTLTGTFLTNRAALRRMVDKGIKGAVVNNSSVLAYKATAGQAHYAAAKGGVNALTRALATDVAEYGIRVNAVAPSMVVHPFLVRVSSEEAIERQRLAQAFKRSAEGWEVANVMVFLASDYASYLTGEIIPVSFMHP